MKDDRDDLFARLSPEGREIAPAHYRFLHPRAARATVLRLVECRPRLPEGRRQRAARGFESIPSKPAEL